MKLSERMTPMIEKQGLMSAKFKVLAFVRTARRIMDGNVYVTASVLNGLIGPNKLNEGNGIFHMSTPKIPSCSHHIFSSASISSF